MRALILAAKNCHAKEGEPPKKRRERPLHPPATTVAEPCGRRRKLFARNFFSLPFPSFLLHTSSPNLSTQTPKLFKSLFEGPVYALPFVFALSFKKTLQKKFENSIKPPLYRRLSQILRPRATTSLTTHKASFIPPLPVSFSNTLFAPKSSVRDILS